MAELFKPEIKDIGGTNVTAYSPPTTDYSGIFNSIARTLDSFESKKVAAPKLSEAEEKNLVLEPYLSKVQKIMSSDDIPEIKRYAMVNGIKTEVARLYPSYNDVFEKATSTITGVLDPDGDPIQKYYDDLTKWGESETGTFARVEAISLAVDKDNNFNEDLYQTKMKELYHKDITDKNSLAIQKIENERYKEGAPTKFRTDFAPKALKDIDDSIKLFTSGQGIKALMDVAEQGGAFGAATPEASKSLAIADQIAVLKKRWDIQLTKKKIEAGYAPNDPQFSNEPLLIQLTSLEQVFRNAGTSVSTVLKTTKDQYDLAVWESLPEVSKRFISTTGLFPQAAAELYTAQWITVPGHREQLTNIAKTTTLIGLDPRVPTLGSGTSTTDFIPSGPGVSFDQRVASLPEFSPEMIKIIDEAPPVEKKAVLEASNLFIENGKLSDENTIEVVTNKLGASYLIFINRLEGDAETGVTPLSQTKISFGPKAFNLISEIQKKNPVFGEDLYPKVNKAIMTETVRHMAFLETSLTRNFPNNPLVIKVNEKGTVELSIDPRAKKEDPVFRRLTEIGFESDEEILNNLQTSMGINPSFFKALKNSVESLNIYLMASNRLPDSLKNSPDFAGVFIRNKLANLPKYGGANIFLEQMGQ